MNYATDSLIVLKTRNQDQKQFFDRTGFLDHGLAIAVHGLHFTSYGFVLSKYPGRAHCLTSWVRPHVDWAYTPKFEPYGFGPSKTLFFLFFYYRQLKEAGK